MASLYGLKISTTSRKIKKKKNPNEKTEVVYFWSALDPSVDALTI